MRASLGTYWRTARNSDSRVLMGIAGLLVVLGAALVFLLLAQSIAGEHRHAFDEVLLKAARRPDDPSRLIGPPWIPELVRDITSLGSASVLLLLVFAVCGFLALTHRPRSLFLLLLSTLGGFFWVGLLKGHFGRARPSVVPQLMDVSTPSFPSGHAMVSAVVFLTLAAQLSQLTQRRVVKAYIVFVAVLLTVLVGISRVLLGVHYPSDVLAGWVAGLAWAFITGLVGLFLRRKDPVLHEESKPEHT